MSITPTGLVRCFGCEAIYDQSLVACPVCHGAVRDELLAMIPVNESKPVLNFQKAMYNFPRVFGVPVTSRN
jgi:hypothetical protein